MNTFNRFNHLHYWNGKTTHKIKSHNPEDKIYENEILNITNAFDNFGFKAGVLCDEFVAFGVGYWQSVP